MPPKFVRPCHHVTARSIPRGDAWLHEPKLDGYRLQIVKDEAEVPRLAGVVGAKASPARSCLSPSIFVRQTLLAIVVGVGDAYCCCALVLVLGGCSTPYQDMGLLGGVDAQRMTADTYRIVARGNAYTGGTQIQDYTMLKAAETAKQAGATHFAIISASNASRTGAIVIPGQAQTSVVGNTAYTTYSPATAHQYVKPGQDTYIRVFTIPPGQQPPPGLLSVDEIINFVGSRVQRPT